MMPHASSSSSVFGSLMSPKPTHPKLGLVHFEPLLPWSAPGMHELIRRRPDFSTAHLSQVVNAR